MPSIVSVATALPSHTVEQAQARDFVARLFGSHSRDVERMLSIFDHAQICRRHLAAPPEWFARPHGLKEKNALYQEVAKDLGTRAAAGAIAHTGLNAHDIDAIVFVSSTGLATPSLDVTLAARLGCRPDVTRIPLWGLGCAGGAAGIARASEYVAAHPDRVALVVAVELCSLTFVWGDWSRNNLVGTALFSDGAAAAIVAGDGTPQSPARPRVVGSLSHLFPDTQDVMAWDVRDDGLGVIFSRDIPLLVEQEMGGQIDTLFRKFGENRGRLSGLILHPGGPKVLDAYARSVGVPPVWLEDSRHVLQEYGNMSSPTVLFVLERSLRRKAPGLSVLAALGPGFSCEQVLLDFA